MAKKKKKKQKWFVKNLILAVVFLVGIVTIAQVCLSIGTRHGKEIEVPDFSEMSLSEAEHLAAACEVRLDVTDSVFTKRMARGAVFSQNPAPGSHVKKGRRILITINAVKAKTVAMPDLVGYSLRQAKTEILQSGLKVGRLSYKEDIATNNVLEQHYKGKIIAPGREIETDSRIDLVLGLDPNNSQTFVPDLAGYSCEVAIDNIIDDSFNIGRIHYDETVKSYSDSLEAVVYSQSPEPDSETSWPLGTEISISLTKSQSKAASRRK